MASRKETSSGHQRTEYGDQQIERGVGGEIHRVAAGEAPRLTTQQGIVVSDDQNTLRAGERGPGVLGRRLTDAITVRRGRPRPGAARAGPPGTCTMVRPPVRLEESW